MHTYKWKIYFHFPPIPIKALALENKAIKMVEVENMLNYTIQFAHKM